MQCHSRRYMQHTAPHTPPTLHPVPITVKVRASKPVWILQGRENALTGSLVIHLTA